MSRKISLYISAINRPAAEQVLSQLTDNFEISDGDTKIAIKAQFNDRMAKALRMIAGVHYAPRHGLYSLG